MCEVGWREKLFNGIHIKECLCLEISMTIDYILERVKADETGKREQLGKGHYGQPRKY